MEEEERLGSANLWTVIGVSGVGTMIEWYNFSIFGSLALVLASQFFPSGNQTLAVLSTWPPSPPALRHGPSAPCSSGASAISSAASTPSW